MSVIAHEIQGAQVLSDCADWSEKNYQAVIRKFRNGNVEVCTKAVRAMERMAIAQRWLEGAPAMPDNITDSQRDRIMAERASYAARRAARIAEEESNMTAEEVEAKRTEKAADSLARSVRRARQQVRFHCKMLGVDHLLTLTYRENMEDVERLERDWKAFVRLVRKVKPNWQYVACREKQDRGAYHLHVAVVGRQDINLLRRSWYKVLGGTGDERGEDTPGQIDVRGPSKRWGKVTADWKASKLAGYMTKYLHKAFEEIDSKASKRYWSSRGIEKPEVVKVWLASSSFVDAVTDTHTIFRNFAPRTVSLWASEGYECIWISG